MDITFVKEGDTVSARVPVRFQSGVRIYDEAKESDGIGRGVASLWLPCEVRVVDGKIIAEMDVSKHPGEPETLLRRFIEGFNGGK